jgi:hypothetical protein
LADVEYAVGRMMVRRHVVFSFFAAASFATCGIVTSLAAGAHAETRGITRPDAGTDGAVRLVRLPGPHFAPAPTVTTTAAAATTILSAFVASPTPPDPPPTRSTRFHLIDLRYHRGTVTLVGTRIEAMSEPTAAPRVIGRFAVELFEGPTLIERVRFDFPFLGSAAGDAGPLRESRLEAQLTSAVGVRFPALARGTRLELLDRKTGERWALPWPLP